METSRLDYMCIDCGEWCFFTVPVKKDENTGDIVPLTDLDEACIVNELCEECYKNKTSKE